MVGRKSFRFSEACLPVGTLISRIAEQTLLANSESGHRTNALQVLAQRTKTEASGVAGENRPANEEVVYRLCP